MLKIKDMKLPESDLLAILFVLKRVRVSIFLLLASAVLFLSDQGSDLLIAIVESGKQWSFSVAVSLLAVSIWLWDRMLLNICFPDQPLSLVAFNRARRWVPRVLGFCAYLFALAAISNAGPAASPLFYSLILGVVFVLFTWRRRAFSRKTSRMLQQRQNAGAWSLKLAAFLDSPEIDDHSEPRYANWQDSLAGFDNATIMQALRSLHGLVVLGVVLFGLGLAIVSCIWPVTIGEHISVSQLFLLWAITLLPIGTIFSYWADKTGLPIFIIIIFVAVVSSRTNDNHEIRQAEHAQDIHSRKTVTEALVEWGMANAANADTAVPFVVVATAGGGIRAAYWTGTVLGTLHDDSNTPNFDRQLFAISGVSGGSVGAAMYRTLLSAPSGLPAGCTHGATDCLQQILGRNFLGPVAVGMLYPDLIQRFIFFPVFADRGVALEKAWENAYANVSADNTRGFRDSLVSLSAQPRISPSLFLNATWAENGRRIVASNLKIDTQPGLEANIFSRSNDQLAILGHDIGMSTAAHNSARFPFISPPGMWKNKNGDIAGRLQDGGLFENYGAETAMEIIQLACNVFVCADENDKQVANSDRLIIKPVVIVISSDPGLPDEFSTSLPGKPIGFAYEVRTTGATYEHARSGHAAEAAARLQEMAGLKHGKFFHFRMCNDMDGNSPPLGWMLSNSAQEKIKSYLVKETGTDQGNSCSGRNYAALEAVVKLLGATAD